MRILITGASGLLGLNLALEIASLSGNTGEHQVFGLVHSHPLHTTAFTVLQGDLLAPGTAERLFEETQPDWVINCAALAIVDACETDPVRARQLNTELPAKLAALVARGGARLLHVSTDAVFDGMRGEYTEEDAPNPPSVYGQTKLEGEHTAAEANPDTLIARVNFYGWSLSGKRSLSEFFFYNLKEGKQLMGFTDVHFCPLLVNDLALIFMSMIKKRLFGLYHVVSSECISKFEFGAALAREFGLDDNLISPTSVSEAGLKAARSPNLTLNSDKLYEALNQKTPGIAPGLERYHHLYQQGYPEKIRQLRIPSSSTPLE
ncbi:MAG: SDR family oxidoreductase [Chloroflexota bacterium]|nr:SDR family oxidoreductase [Chloroflexota bacterium]